MDLIATRAFKLPRRAPRHRSILNKNLTYVYTLVYACIYRYILVYMIYKCVYFLSSRKWAKCLGV